jgi:hypothetical protein
MSIGPHSNTDSHSSLPTFFAPFLARPLLLAPPSPISVSSGSFVPRPLSAVGILAPLLLASIILGGHSLSAAEWLTIRGSLVPVQDDKGLIEKSFTIQAIWSEEKEGEGHLVWTLEEGGAGSWSWIDQFGQLQWDGQGRSLAGSLTPTLRYESGEVRGNVPILLVLPRPDEPLAVGSQWEEDGLKHEVLEPAQVGDQTGWLVAVRNNFGEKRTVLASAPTGFIIDAQETVFLGQGDRFRLQYQVAQRRDVTENDWQEAVKDFDRLRQLRAQLEWRAHEVERNWTEQQRELMKESLPQLRGATQTETLATLLRSAEQQARLDRGRAGALDEMRRRAVSSALPDFQLEPLGAPPLNKSDLSGSVTILHFWDYRDSPLREPYGQAGYLDFLSRKYAEQGLQVVGVVVPENVDDPQAVRQSGLGARRFANFMNLDYPLYLDQAGLLGQVGDPRVCEARLPLFVVVGRDGKVAHYHAGHYEVDNNRGLVELEKIIETALKKGE